MRNFSRALRTGVAVVAATAVATGTVSPASAQESNGPKNIIYMIGDGMGYGHVAYNNLFESGQSKYLVDGPFNAEGANELPGDSVQSFEDFNRLSVSTFPQGGSYAPDKAWATHEYNTQGQITDSAAAGTAMATGIKVKNGVLGMSNYGMPQENISERAMKEGKSAGVVSSVPFSHATPAAFAAHNTDRDAYGEIAHEMLNSDLDVVMGAGHPLYDDNNQLLDTPSYGYITEEDFTALSQDETDWNFIEDNADFAALANGEVKEGTRYWGTPQVGSTLQQARSGEGNAPYSDERNDVVDLPTMTKGALNVLGQDEDGFSVMIEGGAIDWTGHANDSVREIEEVQDFNKSVDAAIEWVENNSSWEETLIIVTADHETGYLSGDSEDTDGKWNPQTGAAGELPSHKWYSNGHTNQLVPFFFKGAGSADIQSRIIGTDPVRGDYIDNTDIAKLVLGTWWSEEDNDNGGNDNNGGNGSSSGSNLSSGLAGAGITAAIFGLLAAAAQAMGFVKFDFEAFNKLLRQFM